MVLMYSLQEIKYLLTLSSTVHNNYDIDSNLCHPFLVLTSKSLITINNYDNYLHIRAWLLQLHGIVIVPNILCYYSLLRIEVGSFLPKL